VKKYISIALICLILVPSVALSQDGWKFPTWNPFKKKEMVPASRSVPPTQTSSPFQLPKFSLPQMKLPEMKLPQVKMPAFKAPTFSKPQPPQAWKNFSESSKRFFTKSKHTLLPWTAPQNNQPFTGSQGWSNNQPKPNGDSFLSSLWPYSEPEPQPPRTVNEWLQQPRPSFR
jgi:hypothetical protein